MLVDVPRVAAPEMMEDVDVGPLEMLPKLPSSALANPFGDTGGDAVTGAGGSGPVVCDLGGKPIDLRAKLPLVGAKTGDVGNMGIPPLGRT